MIPSLKNCLAAGNFDTVADIAVRIVSEIPVDTVAGIPVDFVVDTAPTLPVGAPTPLGVGVVDNFDFVLLENRRQIAAEVVVVVDFAAAENFYILPD